MNTLVEKDRVIETVNRLFINTEVFCYGVAWHYLQNKTDRNTRTFVGSYDFHLVNQDGEWKIDRFKFNLKFIDGNPDLEKS